MFHCSVIKVPVILATAILDYHNQEGLSRTFFTFLKLFFSSCFRLFLSFSTASLDYHILLGLSRTFFEVFQFLQKLLWKECFPLSFRQLVYFIISFLSCQQLFSFFNLQTSKRLTELHYTTILSLCQQKNRKILQILQPPN